MALQAFKPIHIVRRQAVDKLRPSTRDTGRSAGPCPLGGSLAHAQYAVDLAPFLHEQAMRGEVAVHDARRLQLDALRRLNTAAHLAADDRLAGYDVAFDQSAFGDEHLATCLHRSDDGAFDLHPPFGADTPYPPSALPDYRQPRLSGGETGFLGEHRHLQF